MKILIISFFYFMLFSPQMSKINAKIMSEASKKPKNLPNTDLNISSDFMDYDAKTCISNAVGHAHAFRYVEKNGTVHKQTIDAKKLQAHFLSSQRENTNSSESSSPKIDVIKAFDNVIIDTASQRIWADTCTFEVQKDHIDCQSNVRIKDKQTGNEVFGEYATVNLKTEKYTIKKGKKQTHAKIVSNQPFNTQKK